MSNFESHLANHLQKLSSKKAEILKAQFAREAKEKVIRQDFIKVASETILPVFKQAEAAYTAQGYSLNVVSHLTEHAADPTVALKATVKTEAGEEQHVLSFSPSGDKVAMEDSKHLAYPQKYEYRQLTSEVIEERVLNFVQDIWVVE